MMHRSLVLPLVALGTALGATACGGPVLEPGSYEVDVTYTRDDLAMDRELTTSRVEWLILEADQLYTLEVGATRVHGTVDGETLVFTSATPAPFCPEISDLYRLVLIPGDDARSFVGSGSVTIGFCNGATMRTEVDVESQ